MTILTNKLVNPVLEQVYRASSEGKNSLKVETPEIEQLAQFPDGEIAKSFAAGLAKHGIGTIWTNEGVVIVWGTLK